MICTLNLTNLGCRRRCVLVSYSLHGSPLLDAGLVTLNPALSTHPTLVCLDLGDCMLGDEALGLICGMLPPDGAKSGNNQRRSGFLCV